MIAIVCSKANQKFGTSLVPEGEHAQYVSPTASGVIHGASKVIIVGSHPEVEKRYRGIMPVEVVRPPKDEEDAQHAFDG